MTWPFAPRFSSEMTSGAVPPALTVVTCGAPLAARLDNLRTQLVRRWPPERLRFIVTTAAEQWITGTTDTWRSHQGPKPSPPQLLVVFPLTFNTANKVAAGVADTPAAAALCEAIGSRTPVIAVPMLKHSLAAHPAWQRTSDLLTSWGWRWVNTSRPGSISPRPEPLAAGTGKAVANAFSVADLANVITQQARLL